MRQLLTWLIQYSDNCIQEVDAYDRQGAINQACHGAPIMLVTRKDSGKNGQRSNASIDAKRQGSG